MNESNKVQDNTVLTFPLISCERSEMSEWVPPGQIVDGTHFKVLGPADSHEIVCCVHGVGSYHSVFDQLAEHLAAANFKVILYDLIGRGHSANHTSEKFGADEHLEQLRHLLIDTLAIKIPIHIIAHSMGGALSALYVSKYPNEIKSVTFLAPAGLMNSGPLPLIRNVSCVAGIAKSILSPPAKQQQNWRNDFYNHTGSYLEAENAMVHRMTQMYTNNEGAFNAFWQCVLQFPLYGLDEEVQSVAQHEHISVFLLWGKDDVAVPLEPSFTRWTTHLKGGKCKLTSKVIERAGHGFLLEYPEQTHSDILSFLQSVSAAQDAI